MNGLETILAIWKALESTKDGKKVNVLCIVDRNHKRLVVVLDHFSNLEAFFWYWSTTSKMRREYLFRDKEIIVWNLKKGKLKTKKVVKNY